MSKTSLNEKAKYLEELLKDTHIRTQDRIEEAGTIVRELIKNPDIEENTLYLLAGNIYQTIVKGSISNFRKYMPLSLSLLEQFTDVREVKYWGYVKERTKEGGTLTPSFFVLKAAQCDNRFEWAGGIIDESQILVNAMKGDVKKITRSEYEHAKSAAKNTEIIPSDDKKQFEMICTLESAKKQSSILVPLRFEREGEMRDHGMMTLLGEHELSDKELGLVKRLSDTYITPHLQNFSILRRDSMTGLYAQGQKEDLTISELMKAKKNNYPLTLLLADLDNFKKYNDTYGHLEGDHLLKQFGNTLLEITRPTDRNIRYGGEEAMILAPRTTYDKGKSFAEKLRKFIQEHNYASTKGKRRNITISIGGFTADPERIPEEEDELKDYMRHCIKAADDNLYRAKDLGKNRVVF